MANTENNAYIVNIWTSHIFLKQIKKLWAILEGSKEHNKVKDAIQQKTSERGKKKKKILENVHPIRISTIC